MPTTGMSKVYLTLNAIVHEDELGKLKDYIKSLNET